MLFKGGQLSSNNRLCPLVSNFTPRKGEHFQLLPFPLQKIFDSLPSKYEFSVAPKPQQFELRQPCLGEGEQVLRSQPTLIFIIKLIPMSSLVRLLSCLSKLRQCLSREQYPKYSKFYIIIPPL